MEAIKSKASTSNTSQIDAIKVFMKVLKLNLNAQKEEIERYNPELKNGKGRTVTIEELDSLWK